MPTKWFIGTDNAWHKAAYGPIGECGVHADKRHPWVPGNPPSNGVVCADCAD